MVRRTSDWRDELGRWLKPFLDRLGHKARRQMCPLYVSGLIGPGDRKSIQPMAKRLALGECDQLHHFIAAGVWDATPVETELLIQADRLVGGDDAVLVIDDTAIPKKGTHSVGVAAQYASALGNEWSPTSASHFACPTPWDTWDTWGVSRSRSSKKASHLACPMRGTRGTPGTAAAPDSPHALAV